jgi:cobalt/nickel transport protein
MNRKTLFIRSIAIAVPLLLVAMVAAQGHFGMLIPSEDIADTPNRRDLSLSLLFTHPFEGHTMNMEKPRAFGVLIRGRERRDLLSTLTQVEAGGHKAWKTAYRIQRPGDHIFFMEPVPYWEPAEQKFIVHYTKVVVNGLGCEEGWDAELGLKTEIIPLVRPYGLYTGNLFRGIVKVEGKPAPFAEVEVEYYNASGVLKAPRDTFVTQVVKTDGNGVFAYAMPRAGWWGFAALGEDSVRLKHEGKPMPVEIGAVMWVHCVDMK